MAKYISVNNVIREVSNQYLSNNNIISQISNEYICINNVNRLTFERYKRNYNDTKWIYKNKEYSLSDKSIFNEYKQNFNSSTTSSDTMYSSILVKTNDVINFNINMYAKADVNGDSSICNFDIYLRKTKYEYDTGTLIKSLKFDPLHTNSLSNNITSFNYESSVIINNIYNNYYLNVILTFEGVSSSDSIQKMTSMNISINNNLILNI